MCSTCGCSSGRVVPVTTLDGRHFMCTTCGCSSEEHDHDHGDGHHHHDHDHDYDRNRGLKMVPGGKQISVETDIPT